MREILFRGKRKDNSKWVEGYLYQHEPPLQCFVPEGYVSEQSKWYIANTGFADWNMIRPVEFVEVELDTVGQFIGTCAYNGQKIYEGDIIEDSDPKKKKYHVKFNEASGAYELDEIGGQYFHTIDCFLPYQIKVIGNIHDNPELLEVEE